jgi:hypothetical protein
MVSKMDVQNCLAACLLFSKEVGLSSGSSDLSFLQIDWVKPPNDFLGTDSNPAIFVNEDTYRLLSRFHPNWISNKTIALKEKILDYTPMLMVGIIAHEAGHAFNISKNISNTEANAYIFEIECLRHLYQTNSSVLADCSTSDFLKYFNLRLPFYTKYSKQNPRLEALINMINDESILTTATKPAIAHFTPQQTIRVFIPIGSLVYQRHRFFIPKTGIDKSYNSNRSSAPDNQKPLI